MGQVLHGSATTTEAIRRAIQQHSQGSLRTLAKRYGSRRGLNWTRAAGPLGSVSSWKSDRSVFLSIMQQEAASAVAAVGLWATRKRCPSCPQP
jgi:hypothetical protein